MTLKDQDAFIVSRDQVTYYLQKDNLMADLKDDDLMLVTREGVPFRATGEEIKSSFGPTDSAPTITSISLAGGPGFSGKSYVTTLDAFDGVPAASKTMKAKVTGELWIAGETSPITDVEADPSTVEGQQNVSSYTNWDDPSNELVGTYPFGEFAPDDGATNGTISGAAACLVVVSR